MATEIKKRIGTVPCPLCGTICAVKINGRDTLNYVCHTGCDNPGWAKAGTLAHKIISERMTPIEDKPAPAAVAAPAEKPAPKQSIPHIPKPEKNKLGFFS